MRNTQRATILHFIRVAIINAVVLLSACGGGGGGGGGGGSSNSSPAPAIPAPTEVIRDTAPTISREPEGQSVMEGTDATFSVSTAGAVPLTYVWYKSGVPLSSPSSNILVLPRVTAADDGAQIKVRISNSKGSVTSKEVSLKVTVGPTPPSLSLNLSSQDVQSGQPVTFRVEAAGTAPFSYQWSRNNQPVPGQSSSTYTFTAQSTDNGARFQVRISNVAGSTDSAVAVLNVSQAVTPITISSQPRDQQVSSGATALFSVGASSSTQIRYQWYKNGALIQGATQSSYQFTATLADSGAIYSVRLSNGGNEVSSQTARLTVTPIAGVGVAPRITVSPAPVSASAGQSVSFSVSAEGTSPFQFQWLKNGRDISNATQQIYRYSVSNVDVSSDISVRVSNAYGSVTSSVARLTISAPSNGQAPQITRQPSSTFVGLSEAATLSVQASGSGPLTYEWFYYPDAFSDASKTTIANSNTSDLLLVPRLLDASAGKFHKVRVSNPYGSVESEPILVDRADFDVSAISPLQVSPGDIVTITGLGLNKVLKVRLAGNEMSVISQGRSDTQIQFEVPANAVSSALELSSASDILVSKNSLTVRPFFVVNSLSPDLSYENWNGRVAARATLSGSGFSQLKSAYIVWPGNVQKNLTVVSQSDSQVTLELPYVWRGLGDIVSTPIYLARKSDSKVQATSLSWKIADRIIVEDNNLDTVAGQGSAISAPGEEVTIRLVKNIPKNSRVQIMSNGSVVTEVPAVSNYVGPVSFVIPDSLQAGTYQLRLRGDRGQDDYSTSPMRALTVVARSTVTNPDALTNLGVGATLQIVGSNLNNVSQVTIGSIVATVVQKSYGAVSVTVPQSTCGGAIQLKTPYQSWFNGGANIFSSAGCVAARVAGAEVGQLFAHIVNNQTYQRLVPNKASWVRAYVTSPTSGVTSPKVVARVYNDATYRGEITLIGPQYLPLLPVGQALPTTLRQSHDQGFMGTIPADWVRTGLKVTVVSNPDDSSSSKYSSVQTAPKVGASIISPKLMIVPIVDASGRQPIIPATDEVRTAINNYLPLVGSEVDIRVRANPLRVGACGSDSRLNSSCGNYATTMLYNIEGAQLPNIYHGVYSNPSGGGQAYQPGHSGASGDFNGGLGYRPNGNDYGVLQVMMHELTHNFNMGHVRGRKTANNTCGTPVEWSIDPDYPYSSNGLYEFANPNPPIFREPYTGRIAGADSDLLNNDTQSYCSDRAFHSDYSTNVMRSYLEGDFTTESRLAQAASDLVFPQGASTSSNPGVLIAGVVFTGSSAYGIRNMTPIKLDSPSPSPQSKSRYTLRVVTTDGRAIVRPIKEMRIPDSNAAEQEIHFFEKIAGVGQVQSVTVLFDGKPLKLIEGNGFLSLGQSDTKGALNDVSIQSLQSTGRGASGLYRIRANGKEVAITWDKGRFELLTVSLVTSSGRQTLVLNGTGGAANFQIPTESRLDDKLEIAFSKGLTMHSTTVRMGEIRRK